MLRRPLPYKHHEAAAMGAAPGVVRQGSMLGRELDFVPGIQPITPPKGGNLARDLTADPPARVRDARNYAFDKTGTITLIAASLPSFLIIPKSDTLRNFLLISYLGGTSTTVGLAPIVAIDFGRRPDAVSCIQVTAGFIIGFDDVIPQDDIWVGFNTLDPVGAGYLTAVVSYVFSDMNVSG